MLLVSTSRRASLFVPVGFIALMGSASVSSTLAFLDAPSVGGAFGWLIAVLLLAFVLSMIVVGHVVDGRVVARTLFGRALSCDHTRAAAGFRVFSGAKGGTEYTIQVSDGGARIDLATAWTRRGAVRDVQRLADAFDLHAGGSRDANRAAMAAAVEAWDRGQAEARARLAATYASTRTWTTALVVLAVLAVAYGLVLAFVLGRS